MLSRNDLNSIFQKIGATKVIKELVVQNLWSNYGFILKLQTDSRLHQNVVIKKIKIPKISNHPRGWDTETSNERKIKSYKVENYFYQNYGTFSSNRCYFPKLIGSVTSETETLLILEDLDANGFSIRKTSLTPEKSKLCIKWLAHFHGTFLGFSPEGLWEKGTYWHLETRMDELKATSDSRIKSAAPLIDDKLNNCKFKTILHGDAKVANFCFGKNNVSAVDFQYVGGGCGIKDLAYFLGSSLKDEEIISNEEKIFDYYFSELRSSLDKNRKEIEFKNLRDEWIQLYPYAWADFHRFLTGWRPGHWKLGDYSTLQLNKVLNQLNI